MALLFVNRKKNFSFFLIFGCAFLFCFIILVFIIRATFSSQIFIFIVCVCSYWCRIVKHYFCCMFTVQVILDIYSKMKQLYKKIRILNFVLKKLKYSILSFIEFVYCIVENGLKIYKFQMEKQIISKLGNQNFKSISYDTLK